MFEGKTTERDLVAQFRRAKEKRDNLKDDLKAAQVEYDMTESRLIELLESNSAISTDKYEGLVYEQIQKPRLYASCKEENMERLFDFLREKAREDLIKTTVMPQTLSSFVKECIETGIEIPDYVSYYLKPSIRLYA